MRHIEGVEVRQARATWQASAAELKRLYVERDTLRKAEHSRANDVALERLRHQIAEAREVELADWRGYCALFDDVTLAAERLLREQIAALGIVVERPRAA